MKRAFSLFACCFVAYLSIGTSYAQMTQDHDKWDKFGRLCGRLESTWAVPEGKHPKYSVQHRKALGKVSIELFEWREGAQCCSGLSMIESVTTKRSGSFDFVKAKPGKYFLVAHWKSNSPSIAITVTGQESKAEACGEQGLEIDEEGKLQKFLTVKVD